MTHRTLLGIGTLLALVVSTPWTETPVGRPAQPQSPAQSPAPAGQTRTRLADGRWLVVGGEGAAAAAAASIWDPQTNTVAPTAGLPVVPRAWHTATLLPDGTVLLVGGKNNGGLLEIPERFEPATGTFTPLSVTGAVARALHTATLLLDGRVLVAGGTRGDAGPLGTELWDVTARDATPVGTEGLNRSGHTATLAGDGRVLVSGGQTLEGTPAADRLVVDPAGGSVVQLREEPPQPVVPTVAASIPASHLTDVPIDGPLALRFSEAMAIDSLSPDTVILSGPDGVVTTAVIAAEEGRLAFVWPSAPLADGVTYELTVTSVVNPAGTAIVPASIRFTTKRRPAAASDNATVPEAWMPNAQDGEHGWRTNRPPSPWESLAPLMAPAGVTAVSGRVLRLDGRPLPEVTLEIDGHETQTDRTGRFLLAMDPWTSRMAELAIDARTASRPNRTYGFYEARIAVRAGRTNVLPFTIWSPLIDTAHQVTIPSPTVSETVISTPLIPGLELHLPAGTVITDEDHQIARTISITPIPLDRTPFPLPDNATFSMFFTIQPGGAYLSTPGPIKGGWLVYPNIRHSKVGSRVQFFNYDPDDKGWYPYGMGTMTATSVVPDAKTRIYGFTGASFNDGTPTPSAGPPPGDCCGKDGDPVNLTTGIFTYEMTDLVVSDVLPLVLTRTYNSQDPYNRAFGTGMSHTFGLFEHSEQWPVQADLYLPDGAKIHFDRISDPSLPTEQTVFEHATTPTGFYKARMTFWGDPIGDHGWNVTLNDGTVYVFPHAGSPLQAIRDRHGNEIRLTWGPLNQLQRITSPNGRWMAFTYGTGGRVSQVSDNIGRTVSYTYDGTGRLSTVTDPENHVTSYTWDANNRMATVKPPNLQGTATNLVTNEYYTEAGPTQGWLKKQTLADGGVYQFGYSVSNGKSTETTVTDPRDSVRQVTFNPAGYTLSDTRAVGQPEQQGDTSDRPGTGNFIASLMNTHGDVTTTDYDDLGRVTRVTRLPGTADEAITTYTYDPVWTSEVATITDPLNHTMTFEYDEQGNRKSVTDALNHTTTFAYNLAGQVTSVTDPLQHTTTYEYAGPDLVKITDPLLQVTQRFFDAAGRLLSETDPAGQMTRFTYDKVNHLTQVTDPLGGITTYAYDTAGRLGNVTDALTHATTYGYDVFDRLTSRTDPLSKMETFTYDVNGNPSQRTDRKGQVTTRSYDALNRLHHITYADTSTITYTYDSGNRVTTIADSVSGPITRDYDDLDRLISEMTPQGSISYTYDKADRRVSMTVNGQPTVTYEYDDANRLTSITQGASAVTLTYDNGNRRSSLVLPNGIELGYTYDNASQLTALTYTLGQSTLGTLTYGYDLAGLRIEVGGTWARTGLPQAVTSTSYDAANRLLQWSNQILSYDVNGNLASDGPN
jgi:YD repeat-containing protein